MSSLLQKSISTLCSQVRWVAVGHHLPLVEPLTCGTRFYTKDCGDKKKDKKKKDCGDKKKEKKESSSCILSPIPKKRYPDVVEHMMSQARSSTLARCFKDKGQREKQLTQWAINRLNEGLSSAVLVGMDKKKRGGCIVSACLGRVLPCERINDTDVNCFGKKDDDPFLLEIKRMLLRTHKHLDLCGQLCVNEIFDLAYVTEDPDFRGKGFCTEVIKASLLLGANKGLKAVKSDALNSTMAKCVQKACLTEVFSLKYSDYKFKDKVVFPDTQPPDDKYRVFAGLLTCEDPYVEPVKIKVPQQKSKSKKDC